MNGDHPQPPLWQDQSPQGLPVENPVVGLEFDFNRLAENVRLTVQALQALHAAFDQRFTR